MEKRLFVANWKSNKTISEARVWFEQFSKNITGVDLSLKEVIVCPSYTLLPYCHEYITEHALPVLLGAQDISPYGAGAYTGEVNAMQIKEFATHVIIGHSERENYLHEDRGLVNQKIAQAKEGGLKSILCLRDAESFVEGADVVVYEPPSAISTNPNSKPEDPIQIKEVMRVFSQRTNVPILYGGSVNRETIGNYISIEGLAGFLIGGASLEADSFLSLLAA